MMKQQAPSFTLRSAHQPKNVNLLHAAEVAAGGFNQKLAVLLTRAVGSMPCAYLFAVLALLGWPGMSATAVQWVQWMSQTFIQLVMLSVIMVGQQVLSRKQELQAEQEFLTTQKTYADAEEIRARLERIETALTSLTKEHP